MNIKVKTTKVETEEKEITLPYFFKRAYRTVSADYYAIFSEDKAMVVYTNISSITCCVPNSISDKLNDADISECSEEEFTEAFETAMEIIQSMIPVTK